MKLKSTVVSAMLAASMAAPAFANEAVAAPLPEFTMQVAQAMFEIGGAIGLASYAYGNWGNMTWGLAVNRGLSNPFTLQSNAQQAARFNFSGITPATVHHRLNGTGFNRPGT